MDFTYWQQRIFEIFLGNFGELCGIMGTKFWALSEIKGGISHNSPKFPMTSPCDWTSYIVTIVLLEQEK